MSEYTGQAAKWAVRSVGGLLANLALLTVWVDYVGIPPWLAIAPNWVILSVLGYLVTDQWVFNGLASPDGWLAHVKQFVGSESIMLGSKALNYLIYLGLLPLVDYRVAWVVGAGCTFLLTFAGNRWWWARRGQSTLM